MATTPNMGLDKPVVSNTLGPEWATLINAIIDQLDAHDHSDGKGVKVTPAGMLINAILSMEGNKLAAAKSLGLNEKTAADTGDIGTLQRINGDFYWITPSGVAVQITAGTSVVSAGSGALSVGGIAGYPYSVVVGDNATVKLVDTTAARTINFPAATNTMYFYLKDISGEAQDNNISCVPNGTDLIDRANATFLVDWNDAFIGFISDGVSKWWVM